MRRLERHAALIGLPPFGSFSSRSKLIDPIIKLQADDPVLKDIRLDFGKAI